MQAISFTRVVRGVLVAILANGAPGLSLLPVLCGAQTIPADTSAIGPHRANLRAPSEETAIRPFRVKIPKGPRRPPPANRCDKMARTGIGQ